VEYAASVDEWFQDYDARGQAIQAPQAQPQPVIPTIAPATPQSESTPDKPRSENVPLVPDAGAHYSPQKNGTVCVSFKLSGKWGHRYLNASTAQLMRAQLGGLAHDHEAVARWIANLAEAQRSVVAEPEEVASSITNAEKKAKLYEQCEADGIDSIRIASIMSVYRTMGGQGKEAASRHLTPLVRWYMKEQGGEAAEFVEALVRDGILTEAVEANEFIVPKPKMDRVLDIAALLSESQSAALVDGLADALAKCFGDTHSSGGFCKIGHRIRNQEINLIEFRNALEYSLKVATQAENPAAMFIWKLRDATRKRHVMRRQTTATRHLQTA
jgi:hypothetical protein